MSIELTIRKYTPAEIAAVTGGSVFGGGTSITIDHVSIDSRKCCRGCVFFAIAGERFDGHDFIADAVKSGASCIVADRMNDAVADCGAAVVRVSDTIKALGALAAHYASFSTAKKIAVTGSVGKTTTKEMIAAVASVAYKTHKTEGNYNNEIGLPLTLFRLAPDDMVSVLEMGMSNIGEIEYMSRLARPDIAVVTNIGTSHIAALGTRDNICRAKMEIAAGLSKNGTLLLNGDEPLLLAAGEKALKEGRNTSFISLYNRNAEYRAINVRSSDAGMVFDMIYNGTAVINIDIPVPGKHNVYNALAAYSVGTMLGMSDDQIRRGLSSFENISMRQNIYTVGGITIIEDCYNASPESMRAALEVLSTVAAKNSGRATALLGDMLELGENSRLMHDQLGQAAAASKLSVLYCYGSMADVVAEAAIKKGVRADNVYVCLDSKNYAAMGDMILSAARPGDILLVKASRAVEAEKVIEYIKKNGSRRTTKN